MILSAAWTGATANSRQEASRNSARRRAMAILPKLWRHLQAARLAKARRAGPYFHENREESYARTQIRTGPRSRLPLLPAAARLPHGPGGSRGRRGGAVAPFGGTSSRRDQEAAH